MTADALPALPEPVARALDVFLDAAREALGTDLRSVVLFGSAAEGRLRPTSDVNLIVVLAAFEPARADALREPLRVAHAAARLEAMFLLESELPAALEAFAVKFGDVLRRRRVLHGPDPFAGLALSREAQRTRLRQVLLNLTLRLRQRYLLQSPREEQAALALADAAGPLRACAATLLELEGAPAPSPKEALVRVAGALPGDFAGLLAQLSEARERRPLSAGSAGPALLRASDLARAMSARAEALR
jgi:predicted nucleotidyltransferase